MQRSLADTTRRLLLMAGLAGILLALLLFLIAGSSLLRHEETRALLESARLASASLAAFLEREHTVSPEVARGFAQRLSAETGLRVTIVSLDGSVVYDSEANPEEMDNHSDRPEISLAIRQGYGTAARHSTTTGTFFVYAAVRTAPFILRLARPFVSVREHALSFTMPLIAFMLLSTLAMLGVAVLISSLYGKPLRILQDKARTIADSLVDGNQTRLAEVRSGSLPREYAELDQVLDALLANLGAALATSHHTAETLEAILESTEEAIIAVREDGSLLILNSAAKKLFGIDVDDAGFQDIQRMVPLAPLVPIFVQTRERQSASLEELSLFQEDGTHILRAAARVFTTASGEKGVVIVCTDITPFRTIERIKRDFVANVSHELRTPIQIVRGYAEMLEHAVEDEASRQWVSIIHTSALRMERIISDLLTLARLEQERSESLPTETFEIRPMLEYAINTVRLRAPEEASITLDCPEGLRITANMGLLEQAVFNLVENAVKYSGPQPRVEVHAHSSSQRFVLQVRDHGPGIPPADLPRIFERFYRVDKSRSRESGGTGLGLSIVKHIALIHGGEVSAESWAGEGSVFTFSIPQPDMC